MNIKEKNKERNVLPILPEGKIQGIFELSKEEALSFLHLRGASGDQGIFAPARVLEKHSSCRFLSLTNLIRRSLEFFRISRKNREDLFVFAAQKRDDGNMKNRDDSFFSMPVALVLQRHFEAKPKNPAQSGRSMVEMLGVLAIIGVLSVGGIAGYTKAMWQYKINKEIEIITQTVTNMQTLYASQTGNCKYTGGNYDIQEGDDVYSCCGVAGNCYNDDKVLAIMKQVLPDETHTSNKYVHSLPSGGEIYVYPTGIYNNLTEAESSANGRGFVVDLVKLSKKECLALATYDWGRRSTGLIGYSAGDEVIEDLGYNTLVTYGCQGTAGPVTAMWYSNANIAIACPGGSVVGVPMPLNVAVDACANCDDDPEIGCCMQFIYE